MNTDDDLAGKVYFDIVTDESIDAKPEPKDESENEEFNEFEQMLYDFVNDKLEESPTEEPEPQEPEEPETPTTKSETIDQNLGLSVDIEILDPIENPREELDKMIGCEHTTRPCKSCSPTASSMRYRCIACS